ncbi:MAG: FAD:protein FMN transferase [Lachnospiraceae bacterium]|nr:FAD:protein FMN transferase [Lachnospiraceae bacterium]
MRKRAAVLLVAAVLLSGCAVFAPSCGYGQLKRYETSFLDVFDTVTYVKGYALSEEAFRKDADAVHETLVKYHRLYDIYHTYDGIANLKTVNDRAGTEPVRVDREILDLLLFARSVSEETGGAVDVTLGAVLSLWHEAREYAAAHPGDAYVPSGEALREAARHTGFGLLEIDEEAGTVFLTDPDARLDVGALAKGFATARAAEQAPAGMLLSVGGNVAATGPKPDGTPWVVGVVDPDGGEGYTHTLEIGRTSVVTSGDYQRYFTAGGIRYHHIIDPDTGYPSRRWKAVTVIAGDSGIGDALSTALFILGREAGEKLLLLHGAEGMWVGQDGTEYFSDGFPAYIRDQ